MGGSGEIQFRIVQGNGRLNTLVTKESSGGGASVLDDGAANTAISSLFWSGLSGPCDAIQDFPDDTLTDRLLIATKSIG